MLNDRSWPEKGSGLSEVQKNGAEKTTRTPGSQRKGVELAAEMVIVAHGLKSPGSWPNDPALRGKKLLPRSKHSLYDENPIAKQINA